jgi:putative transposase
MGPAFIAPGNPWQNGYVESFNGKLRHDCLSREWFCNATEARIVIEKRRRFYNHQRTHGSLGYRTPAKARQDWINEGNITIRLTA